MKHFNFLKKTNWQPVLQQQRLDGYRAIQSTQDKARVADNAYTLVKILNTALGVLGCSLPARRTHQTSIILAFFSILLLVNNPSFATDTNAQQTRISGQIRLGAVTIDNDTNNTSESIALGGKLSYKSPAYQNVSVGASFYTTNPVAGFNEEALFLNSNTKGYSILGEAYIKAAFGNTNIKFGRQEIDTPFADTDDIGMIPNTFEALKLVNTSIKNTTLTAFHLHRWAGIDSEKPEKFTRLNDDKGINTLGIIYEPSEKWNLQGWHYHAQRATDLSYVETTFKPSTPLQLGLQFAKQHGAGFEGNVWGISAEYTFQNLTLGSAFNKVTGGKVSNGFGGGPFFTSTEDHTIADVDNQQATSLSLEYTGIPHLTLGVNYGDFDKTKNELDLSASYAFNKALSFDIIHSDIKADGNMTRAFLNYNF